MSDPVKVTVYQNLACGRFRRAVRELPEHRPLSSGDVRTSLPASQALDWLS